MPKKKQQDNPQVTVSEAESFLDELEQDLAKADIDLNEVTARRSMLLSVVLHMVSQANGVPLRPGTFDEQTLDALHVGARVICLQMEQSYFDSLLASASVVLSNRQYLHPNIAADLSGPEDVSPR